nr:glycerophosphodiester phosphodiesterase family protein [Renibacterium salmoninarum]
MTGTNIENSLPSFQSAVALGFRHVETDLRTSSDGVPRRGLRPSY